MRSTHDAVKQVGIWIRVSTEDQVRGESPETHERRARLYAESKGWNVVTVYRLDATSGKTVMDHPEAKRMMRDVREGNISGLVFSKLARLARNTKELLDFADTFREHGADLISLAEAIDTSSPAGRLFFTIIAAMATWEREEIAQRVIASVPIRAQLGKPLGGQSSLGYEWKDKKLVVNAKEAPIRRLVYELYREHKRKKTVARLLNEQGFRMRSGAPFTDSTIGRLIQDPTAKGVRRANYTRAGLDKNGKPAVVLKPESEWVFLDVEAIVSEELWTECNTILLQQRQEGKRKGRRPVHLFTGYVYCQCGEKMYVPSTTPKYLCYQCRTKIPIEDLERIYHSEIKDFLFSPEKIADHLERADEVLKQKAEQLEHLEHERRKVQREIDKLYELYQADQIDKHGFGTKYRPLATHQAQLDDQIPAAQAELDVMKVTELAREDVLASARDVHTAWPTFSFEEKRQIVEAITERITVAKDEITIELFASPGPSPPPSDGGQPPQASPPSPTPQGGSSLATKPPELSAPCGARRRSRRRQHWPPRTVSPLRYQDTRTRCGRPARRAAASGRNRKRQSCSTGAPPPSSAASAPSANCADRVCRSGRLATVPCTSSSASDCCSGQRSASSADARWKLSSAPSSATA